MPRSEGHRSIWDLAPVGSKGTRVGMSTNVSRDMVKKCERWAPVLVAKGKIKKATPYSFLYFALEFLIESLEKAYGQQREK